MWCSAVSYDRTDVDDTMNDHMCHTLVISRQDRHMNMTNFIQELDTLCWVRHTTNWIIEQYVWGGCQKNLADDQKAHCTGLPFMHLTQYASLGEQFLQYIVTGDETFVNHMTLKISIASLMCKHPSSPTWKEHKVMP